MSTRRQPQSAESPIPELNIAQIKFILRAIRTHSLVHQATSLSEIEKRPKLSRSEGVEFGSLFLQEILSFKLPDNYSHKTVEDFAFEWCRGRDKQRRSRRAITKN